MKTMKEFFLYPSVLLIVVALVVLVLVVANAEAQDKGSISFQLGSMGSVDTQLEVDFSQIFFGEGFSKEFYDVKAPGFVFGVNFRKNLFEEKPYFVGGSVLFTKPRRNFVVFQGGGLGFTLPTSLWVYVVDFNFGTELNQLSVGRKFVPFVEAGFGFSGIRKSITVQDFFSTFSFDAGSQTRFTKHIGFGARSYFVNEYDEGGFFVGGKVSFYDGTESSRMISGEAGISF